MGQAHSQPAAAAPAPAPAPAAPALTEKEAKDALLAIPYQKKKHCSSYPGWGDMTWAQRLQIAQNPSAKAKADAYDVQYESNGAWGGKNRWDD